MVAGFWSGAYGEGVVLSDTSVDDYDETVAVKEEPFVAPENKNVYTTTPQSNYGATV